MTTNIIRCSEQHAVATKCRNASNGTSQARTRPMRSALSNLNQTPKREVVKSAPHPHLHPHFRHFGDITSPLSNPARSRAKPQRRTAKLPLFHPSSLYIPNHRPKMAQRVTLRKRQPYNTTSNRRRVVKTPGGKLVVHHLKKIAVSLLPAQKLDNARRMDWAKR